MLDEFRHILRKHGPRGLPRRPRPDELWQRLDGDGAGALLVTLEYLEARREALAEIDVTESHVEACECTLGRGLAA